MADSGSWPHGGGEMGERIRAFDWPAIGWSRPEAWPLALRTLIDVMLGSRQPMFVAWGPERRMLYNESYAQILENRHPAALGRRFSEVWADILDDVIVYMDRAFAGQSTHMDDITLMINRRGELEETHFAFSYTPVRDDLGRVNGVYCVCNENTDRVLADRRIRFHFEFSERLRALSDPAEVAETAAEALGRQLGVRRVGYAEVEDDGVHVMVQRDWTDGTLASIAGRHRMDDFGPEIIREMRAGRPVVVSDVRADPRTAGAAAAFEALGARSVMAVPLIKQSRLTVVIFMLDGAPRKWRPAEQTLAQEVAERAWAAVERSRAEGALRESEARFRAMADSAPSPVWMTDAPGAIAFVNQAFADYAGRARAELLGDVWIRLIHPDDLMEVAGLRAQARAGPDPYAFEARFRRADGEWRVMRASSQPRFDHTGAFLGYVGMAADLTDMRRAEAALRESEERFRRMAEDAPVMLWMSDENGGCAYLNRALRTFWGARDDPTAFDWSKIVVPEERAAVSAVFRTALAARESFQIEARQPRADGEPRIVMTRAEPRRDDDGRFIGMIGVNVDVTEERQAESRQRLLINELNHRVKNTLATVQSVILQSLRADATPAQMAEQLQARVLALSAAHDVLTRENWESAQLHEVVAGAVRAHQNAGADVFAVEGPQVRVAPRTALSLAMALHELATNAAKYGALSRPEGRVSIRWNIGAEPRVALEWREAGGPPVTPPARRGFGSRLIEEGLARELGAAAQMDFQPGGLVCRMSAALAEA